MSDAFDRGITVTELAAMDESVDVKPRTVAAFVGRALRGPLNSPVRIGSFAQFSHRFGGVWGHSSLGPAIQHFFEHGGREACVVRVANNATGAVVRLSAGPAALMLVAVEPGSTEHIRASVDYDRIDDEEHFNLTLQRVSPATALVVDQEIHNRLSCRPESQRYVADVLAGSAIVRARLPLPEQRPWATVGPHLDRGGYVAHGLRGSDGDELTDYDLIGCGSEQTGLFALDGVESFDLLYLPPGGRHSEPGPAAILVAEKYCRERGAMLILDPPAAWDSPAAAIAGVRRAGFVSPNLLSYFPRMLDRNDPSRTPRAVGGAIAGLLSKLDKLAGPWNDLDGPGFGFRLGLKPAVAVKAGEAAQLVREGLNVIAGLTSGRATLCGSVTMSRGSQMERKFVSLTARRLCLHITNTIGRATRWSVFQPGGTHMAHRVRAQVHAFMTALAAEGAFDSERFTVQCEAGRHVEPTDPLHGVTILLSFLPADSDEFIWLTLHQTVQGCRVTSTAFAPVTAECA